MTSKSDTRAMGVRCCIAGVIFLLLGIAGFVGMQMASSYADRAQQWPSVDGKIVTSEVSTATSRFKYGVRTTLVADIEYAYTVNGEDFQGEHLRLLPMLHMQPGETPQELVARYPVGRSVKVYYDSGNPSAAVLNPALGDDARKLVRSVKVMAPCIAFLGLVLAGIGAACMGGNPNAAPAAAPAPVTPRQPPPPVKLGIVQRLLLGVATLAGLFLFLIGSLIVVAASGTPNRSGDESTRYVAIAIFAVVTLLGAGLISAGVRRPRARPVAATA